MATGNPLLGTETPCLDHFGQQNLSKARREMSVVTTSDIVVRWSGRANNAPQWLTSPGHIAERPIFVARRSPRKRNGLIYVLPHTSGREVPGLVDIKQYFGLPKWRNYSLSTFSHNWCCAGTLKKRTFYESGITYLLWKWTLKQSTSHLVPGTIIERQHGQGRGRYWFHFVGLAKCASPKEKCEWKKRGSQTYSWIADPGAAHE